MPRMGTVPVTGPLRTIKPWVGTVGVYQLGLPSHLVFVRVSMVCKQAQHVDCNQLFYRHGRFWWFISGIWSRWKGPPGSGSTCDLQKNGRFWTIFRCYVQTYIFFWQNFCQEADKPTASLPSACLWPRQWHQWTSNRKRRSVYYIPPQSRGPIPTHFRPL